MHTLVARFKILTNPAASFARSLFSRTGEVLINRLQHFAHVCKHLIVPESKNSIVPGLQKRSANFIFLRQLGVLGPVEFNNEVPFDRAEVSEVRTNRMLTPEFCVPHSAAAEVSPQQSFYVGLFAAQPPRVPLR